MATKKTRLDQYLVEKLGIESRSKAQALILAGNVLVNGQKMTKAGHAVKDNVAVEIAGQNPYVSRGGLKLEGALVHFGFDKATLKDQVVLDVGISTGGFSDCLLQNGVSRIYGVDVGYGQLAWKLRQDVRVTLLERRNIRELSPDELPEKADLIVIDVSFISILKFLEHLKGFLKPGGKILTLIKPQFEAERGEVGKGGIIRDAALTAEIVQRVIAKTKDMDFLCSESYASPITGTDGNQEYFCLLEVKEI